MALETPNLVQACALLLIEGFEDPPNSTITFATNNGFSSAEFIDVDIPTVGITLAMDQPLNNMEGSVYVGGDAASGFSEIQGLYISPAHFESGNALIDALPANQVVLADVEGSEDVFRMQVFVIAQLALAEAPTGEPVAP